MTACTFCSIAGGELPAVLVYDDDRLLAFLDHRPLFPGHTLVIPRAHVPTLAELPEDLLLPLFGLVQRLTRAIPLALEAHGTFVGINNRVSQSVPHLHVHVVPRRRGDGLRGFFWPRQRYASSEAMQEVAERIRLALAQA
ncbi:HIT family protein [Thermomicrobium sp. 4228-Ro]|uniref:HIT family protein n=1 Tax=Thermomicrobium sp. 4228-Ro TaxID=2993937 RepID=UPI002248B6E7|nr:HIT family protein [Thermomicrobium sp. 4228-Ro]MCX2727925.1 HIT family protein [Thermomicrobium sp. 4228-Ro]